MARELGPAYLPFLCEVLAAALPARGYTAHVLGHTVHALVEGLHKVGNRKAIQSVQLTKFPVGLALKTMDQFRLCIFINTIRYDFSTQDFESFSHSQEVPGRPPT